MEALLNSDTDYLNLYIVPWAINLVMALVIFVLGRWLAIGINRLVKRLMKKANIDDILISFIGNMLYFALLVVVVIAALDQLGVNTSSVLAVFAAAGLAVGLALKDSLSNFAAGVMLVLFKARVFRWRKGILPALVLPLALTTLRTAKIRRWY